MPTCIVDPSFSSIECRLAEIPPQIVVSPDYPELEDKLNRLLTKADDLVEQGQTFADAGDRGRARRSLSRAATRLQKFARAVGSRKGEKAIEETLREQLIDEAVTIRTDVVLLKQSL
jgi:hypothetical protein